MTTNSVIITINNVANQMAKEVNAITHSLQLIKKFRM